MSISSIDKNITLPSLSRLIRYLIGSGDKRFHIHPDDAKIIALADKDENFCHIEFPCADNALEMPCIWYVKEWRTASERLERNKAQAAKERLAANIFRENVDKVAAKIAMLTGLDKERVRVTAISIVRKGNKDELAKLGIKIEEWDRTIRLDYIQ